MSSKTLSKDFTKGNVLSQLILFSLPFMASNALQVLYGTVDMLVVGKFVESTGALTAVSQGGQIVNFATMVCLGFSNAGQVLVAQALGAGKRKEINSIIGTLFTYLLAISVGLTALILALCKPIMWAMNSSGDAYGMTMDYLIICTAGLVFTAGYNMVSAVLRGMGDAKSPFLFIGIATVINIGLDLLFAGLFGWGVIGVAYATIIAQACSFIFSLVYLYIRREGFGFDFKIRSFRPEKRYVGMITSLGTPMAIQSGFINVSMLFVSSMINGISANAADTYGATFGTGLKIDDMINKVSQGIQYAAMPMISQNIGAGDQKRAKDVVYKAWIVTGVLTAFCIAGYAIFGKYLFMVFSDDAVVLDMSGTFIKAILWMFPAFAIMRGTGAFIQGIGNAKLGMVLAMLDGVVLRIGLSWLFGIVLDMGFFGFVLGYALAPYGYAIPSFIYFILGRWKKNKTLADRM